MRRIDGGGSDLVQCEERSCKRVGFGCGGHVRVEFKKPALGGLGCWVWSGSGFPLIQLLDAVSAHMVRPELAAAGLGLDQTAAQANDGGVGPEVGQGALHRFASSFIH